MSVRPAASLPAATPHVDWRGLAIGVEEREGRFLYRVRLVHEDPVQAATVVQTEDERDAVAAWRYWSASLKLPRLVERAPGDYHAMEWRCGELVVRVEAGAEVRDAVLGRDEIVQAP